jgi:hypothetical protein
MSDSKIVLEQKPPLLRQLSAEERALYTQQPNLLNNKTYAPEVTKNAPAPRLGKLNKIKFNSTATIFMKDAIEAPDQAEIIRCVSKCLYFHIKNQETKEPKRFNDIFSELKYPLDNKRNFSKSPEVEEIEEFLTLLFEGQDLVAENGVMAVAYIERLVKLTGITLHASNWRRITLGALILASKIWEDVAVWNVDFLQVFPNLDVSDLNRLEREFLGLLQFTVSLSASIYAKYYFDLRALSDLTEENFPLRPLDEKGVSLLEARSRGAEEEIKKQRIHADRAQSLDPYVPNKTTVSIEQIQKSMSGKWTDL